MKKFYSSLFFASLLIGGMAMFNSCDNADKDSKDKPAKTPAAARVAALPNYRYVDLDTILSRYNLAKDYNEELMRLQSSSESQLRRHESKIQTLGNTMQNKMNNNGYLTQESYEQDQRNMANLQNEAQKAAASLQANYQQAAIQAQQTINDSINAFIEEYNKTRKYDAILFKAATLYINPALDVTDEVVEGLNARYNKVKK